FYNLGGAVVTLRAAASRLLEGPKAGTKSSHDTAQLRGWFSLLALAAPIYWLTGLAGWQWPNVAVAATALGAVLAYNRSQWPAYSLNERDSSVHKSTRVKLNNWAQALSFVPFAILSTGQILGLPAVPFLAAAVAFCTILMTVAWLLSWLLSRRPPK